MSNHKNLYHGGTGDTEKHQSMKTGIWITEKTLLLSRLILLCSSLCLRVSVVNRG